MREDEVARLRRNLASAADWLDAIIAESDPKPSELMAMVAGIREALSGVPEGAASEEQFSYGICALPCGHGGPHDTAVPSPKPLDVERLRSALTLIRDVCDAPIEFEGGSHRVRFVLVPAIVEDALAGTTERIDRIGARLAAAQPVPEDET